jgi:selenocysteine-specific elongation factor
MPQTREHLTILDLLGVRTGVVAITKADLVDAEWLALVEEEIRDVAHHALPNAPIVATSTTTGAGIGELRSVLAELARSVKRRDRDDVFRMPVDRVFSIRGTGTVVTGTVWSGGLRRDESVRVLPGALSARVRGIQSHGAQLDSASPASRAAIALAGVEVGDVPRGSVLVSDGAWRPTTLIRADVVITAGHEGLVRPRTWLRFHVGTSEVGARIVTREMSGDSGRPIPARIVLDEPVVLRAGDRFVLRTTAPLNTIGGGVVADPYAPRRAKPWPIGLDPLGRLQRMLADAGPAGIPTRDLPIRLGLGSSACARIVSDLESSAVEHGGRVTASSVLHELEASLCAAVASHHASFPLDVGAPLQLIRSRLQAPPDLIDLALSRLTGQGELQVVSGALAAAGWAPRPTPAHAALADKVVARLTSSGSEPPSATELAAELEADVEPVLRYLERQGRITQVEQNRYYEVGELKQLLARLRGGMPDGAERTPSELRDLLGVSRKFLIPFLEYCDAAGYTMRSGAGRVWRSK